MKEYLFMRAMSKIKVKIKIPRRECVKHYKNCCNTNRGGVSNITITGASLGEGVCQTLQ